MLSWELLLEWRVVVHAQNHALMMGAQAVAQHALNMHHLL